MLSERKKDEGIEILRVISIILITLSHLASPDALGMPNVNHINFYIVKAISIWGQVGAYSFFIISSFYLSKDNTKFNSKKIRCILFQLFFYIFLMDLCYAVYHSFVNKEGNVLIFLAKRFIYGLCEPLWLREYWFITAYLLLYITIPFLKKINRYFSLVEYKKFIIILTVIIPTFSSFASSSIIMWYVFVVYIFLLTSYLAQDSYNFFYKFRYKGVLLTSSLIYFFQIISQYIYNDVIRTFLLNTFSNVNKGSGIMLILSLFTFYVFVDLKVKISKFSGYVAYSALGIYCFHENLNFSIKCYMARYIKNKLDMMDLGYDDFIVLMYILLTTAIVLCGILVDLVEKRIYVLFENRILGNHFAKLDGWMNEE